jgi:hypothetical protein
MATDPTRNETEGAPEEGRDESTVARTPGPPRPPRPGKRSKESGRISIPLPQSRRELEPVDVGVQVEDPLDAAPGVDIAAAERDEPAFPLIGTRAKAPSAPEESFADIDADFADAADHAPNAPVTPLHGLSALEADPAEITPPRGTPMRVARDEPRGVSKRFEHEGPARGVSKRFEHEGPARGVSKRFEHEGPARGVSKRFGQDDEYESEPEPTIVGKVPDNLLELSGASEENTQAFTAPRELIELAKRSRDERVSSNVPRSAQERETPRPPRAANDDVSDARLPAAPRVPRDGLLAGKSEPDFESESDLEAAPPVKRTFSGEMEAAALPSRRAFDSVPAVPSEPDIDIDSQSDLSPSAHRAAELGSRSSVDSELPSALRRPASRRGWLLTVALFALIGIAIARWREIVALFH